MSVPSGEGKERAKEKSSERVEEDISSGHGGERLSANGDDEESFASSQDFR